jgi:hypothetical protein
VSTCNSVYSNEANATTSAAAGTIVAKNVTSAITVDGSLSESVWSAVNNSATKTVIGTPNNTVQFGALWNSTYLYVGVSVTDANLFDDSANDWDDDGVEIYIDGANNGGTTYDANDRQYIKAYNSTTLFANGNATGVLHGTANIAGGYTAEVAIPWSNLGITPSANLTIGFDVANNDDDDGAGRDNQQVWWGTVNNFSNPSGFGDLILSSETLARVGGTEEEISAPKVITEDELIDNINIFPNPASGLVRMLFSSDRDGLGQIELVDISGQSRLNFELKVSKGNNIAEINTSSLAGGQYLVWLKLGKYKKATKLLMISN